MAQRAQTLAEALNAGRDVFERARASLDQLPQPDAEGQAPATLSDAVQLVQERQSLQQQHKEPKQKQKAKEPAPADPAFPGTRIGGGKDNSAYWTLVDVRALTHTAVVHAFSCAWRAYLLILPAAHLTPAPQPASPAVSCICRHMSATTHSMLLISLHVMFAGLLSGRHSSRCRQSPVILR